MSLLIALGLVGALIQSPAAEQTAAVSGRVVEDGTLVPVAGAQVLLFPMPSERGQMPFRFQPPTSTTDKDGRYRFDGLAAGRYRMSVRKPGFAQPRGAELPEVDLVSGERRDDVDVTLYKGAVIVGRVLDESGEPVLEARVMALHKVSSRPGKAMRGDALVPAGSSAMTNDLGEFRLFSLPPGEYYVQAMSSLQIEGAQTQRATTVLPTFFPGTPDPTAAQPVTVGAGETSVDVVIRMIGAPAFQVSGVVVDQRGRPVDNVMIRLAVDQPYPPMAFMEPWIQSRTDASGRFTVNNVTSGSYTLVAIPPRVTAAPAAAGAHGGAHGSGGYMAFVGNVVSGSVGPGLITETRDGVTVEYREDTGTRVPVVISAANVSGLEVIVRLPAR
jgi:protocatechuate 3,4-dioxygenase beta subunit